MHNSNYDYNNYYSLDKSWEKKKKKTKAPFPLIQV